MDFVEVHLRRLELLFAIGVDEGVLHDLEEPRLEVGALGEALVVLVGLEVGLLQEVLGVLDRPGHPQGALEELVTVGQGSGGEVPLSRFGCLCSCCLQSERMIQI